MLIDDLPKGEFLITNAKIITCDKVQRVYTQGDIHIKDGVIADLGAHLTLPGINAFDAQGLVALPGLINGHTHAGMTLLRGLKDDVDLWEWLNSYIWPAESCMEPEDIYWGSLLACIEMLKAGVTTFVDMYFHEGETARAVEEIGIRAYLCRGIIEGRDQGAAGLEETNALLARWHNGAAGRIKITLGPHAPYTCSIPFLRRIRDFAIGQDLPVHIHVAETKQEVEKSQRAYGFTPVAMLKRAGLLDPRIQLIAAHCVHLTTEDIRLMKEAGVGVVHCLGSNLKLGSGIAPVIELLNAGVKVCYGTDGAASNNNLDIIREMRLAALIHNGISGKPGILPASQIISMATNHAAAILKRPDLGSLEIGKRADIVLLDTSGCHWYPREDAVSSLIYSGSWADVDTVLVNGEFVVHKGKVLTVNEEEVKAQIEKRAWRIKNAKSIV
ncbi:MAG: amidohydrolase [Limnochordia bacterium]|nr:amidohydrolase [Limnochordia bacterium]